ncbi:hypothetical protein LTR28_002526, partial [Elasticomyces elasticus]
QKKARILRSNKPPMTPVDPPTAASRFHEACPDGASAGSAFGVGLYFGVTVGCVFALDDNLAIVGVVDSTGISEACEITVRLEDCDVVP